MRARKRSTSLGAAVVIAVLAAGCGSSHQTSSNSAGPHDIANKAFEFSACMRNHGVANFPDPKVSSSGPGQTQVAMVVPNQFASGRRSSSPPARLAARSCRLVGNISPAQVAQQQQQHKQDLLAFASCLRAHGLTKFPDPTSQGQLTLAMLQNAGVDLHAPDVLPAARACIGVTHGVVTWANVERAVNGTG